MFDTRRFLSDHFHNAEGVITLLTKHGFPAPQPDAAKKWFSRASVPWDWGVLLLVVADKETETPFEIGAYLEDQQHDIFK